ncbi:hypothetical protein CRG98_049147, partial [Punica granatum]
MPLSDTTSESTLIEVISPTKPGKRSLMRILAARYLNMSRRRLYQMTLRKTITWTMRMPTGLPHIVSRRWMPTMSVLGREDREKRVMDHSGPK